MDSDQILMRGLVLFLLLAAFSFGQDKHLMEKVEELRKKGILSEETLRNIEKYKQELKGLKIEGGKMEGGKKGEVASESRRIYVFMSSSVPKEVWYEYVRQAVKLKVDAVFLLRGCINGCKYIKPTLAFIQDVLTLGGKEKDGLPVEVWIDPVKFREYGVSVVPCFAYEGEKKLSCGDWSFEWHLRKLQGR